MNSTASRPSNKGDLVITNNNDCSKLLNENYWANVIVNNDLCQATSNLTISNNPYLESLHFYSSSFNNPVGVIISNIPRLSTLTFEMQSFYNTKELVIKSIGMDECRLKDLPSLLSIHFENKVFSMATKFDISSEVM